LILSPFVIFRFIRQACDQKQLQHRFPDQRILQTTAEPALMAIQHKPRNVERGLTIKRVCKRSAVGTDPGHEAPSFDLSESPVIQKILRHLKLWDRPKRPPPPPARRSIQYVEEIVDLDEAGQWPDATAK
jgi:hypothetical protein